MLPRVVVVAADTAAAAVSTAVAAAVSTAAGLPSAAVGLASTEVWPRAADLVQLGLLPCPAEQASAESLVEASTIVTTSGTSPFLG
jgi:hypothetical protein